MSKKVRKYRLFAMEYNRENVDFTSKFRFSRVTPKYILVYAQKGRLSPPNGNCVEVTGKDIGRLSKLDEAWLFDCGLSIFADAITNQSQDNIDRLHSMVDRLEVELGKEVEEE